MLSSMKDPCFNNYLVLRSCQSLPCQDTECLVLLSTLPSLPSLCVLLCQVQLMFLLKYLFHFCYSYFHVIVTITLYFPFLIFLQNYCIGFHVIVMAVPFLRESLHYIQAVSKDSPPLLFHPHCQRPITVS